MSVKMIRASLYASSVSDQTYQSALGPFRSERDSWNQGWSDGGVVHDEVDDDADPPLVRGGDERPEVLDGPVVGVDPVEVGDVVAAVLQRRGVERQQPDAVDAEPLQVVQLLLQAAEVAGAVVVAVEERARVDLVEDRRLEPERIRLEPVAGLGHVVGLRPDRCHESGLWPRLSDVGEPLHVTLMRRSSSRGRRRARGRRSCDRSASGSSRPSAGRGRGTRRAGRSRAARRRRPRAGGADRG